MEKLYLYIRLSDADENKGSRIESDSIANQRTLLYRYIQSHREFSRYEVVEFVDDGFSGTNGNRPSFERMIESLKNGEASVVICKDFSRFFRDYVEIGDYLERIFPFLGVRFIAVNDGYDSDEYKGSTAGMEVVMKYIVYSYYSKDLSQKIKTVMRTRKSKGEFVASQAPYGYMRDQTVKRRMVPNPETAPVVRRIFDLALDGNKVGTIAKILNNEHIETPAEYFMRTHPKSKKFRINTSKENCWTNMNIRIILKRREYTGALVANQRIWKGLGSEQTVWNDESEWQIIANCHEAIVSEEEYEQAQTVIRVIKKGYERGAQTYLLRRLLRCGNCGRSLQRYPRAKRISYCCNKSMANSQTECPIGEKFYEDDLERIVRNDVMEKLHLLIDTEERYKKAVAGLEGTEENIRERLEQIEKRLKHIAMKRLSAYEQYAEGKLKKNLYLAERDKLNTEADTLSAEKQNLEHELMAIAGNRNRELRETADRAREILVADNLTNETLLSLIERIYVHSGMRLEIIYRFSDLLADDKIISGEIDLTDLVEN